MAASRDEDSESPLLQQRSALILLLAALSGAGAGALVLLAGHGYAEAALLGMGVLAAATRFFHWLIA